MGFYDKLVGNATTDSNNGFVEQFLLNGEEIIQSYKFIRDSIVLTNLGIYMIDVQGITGKKVETKFFPAKVVESISFETAGSLDMDADIKIGVRGNTVVTAQGVMSNAPISFKVAKAQQKEAMEIIQLVKINYLCK